jgi:predicted CXXCH cytochrome family protein
VQCPICTHALEGGELVMVCVSCHQTLGGGLSVNSTGEFKVPTPEEIAAHTSGERPVAKDACAWCHKSEGEVKKLLGRAGTALCNECVSLACDIFEAELGPTWR